METTSIMARGSGTRKVAVITGGSSGIGEAAVELFTEKGYAVASLDIRAPKERRMAAGEGASARAPRSDSVFLPCDVSQEEQVNSAVERVARQFGRIDCLLNFAGVVLVKPLEEISWEDYRRTMDVNFGGIFLTCKHVVPIMKKQRGGSIVNTSSVAGHVGQVRHSVYGGTKGAIVSFTRGLAWELAPYKIRVNSLSPGSVDTPMLREDVRGEAKRLGVSFGQVKKEREAEQAFGRWADPGEIAEASYFLATDSASFITGTDLMVDCGWTAR